MEDLPLARFRSSPSDEGLIPADEATTDSGEPGAADIAAPDPERVLRLRIVFALTTLLTGSVGALFAAGLLGFALSGKVGLLFAAGAVPLALGTFLLLLRAPLRALLAARTDHDELRAATGLVSLACGVVLLAAVAVFLLFTFSVVLSRGGALVLYVLPLVVLAYFTLQFVKEATSDFLRRTALYREAKLFAVSLAYFALTALVFVLLVAASTASPIALRAPPEGAIVKAGTPLDFELTDPSATSATWDDGSGPRALVAPFDIATDGWTDGLHPLTLTVRDDAGGQHTALFNITIDSTPPALFVVSPPNNSLAPVGALINLSAADAHLSNISWTDATGSHALPAPFSLSTAGWAPATYDITFRATDVAGNGAQLPFRITLT